MAKQLAFTDEARKKLKNGIDTMANAVKTTLGPKGRNVALDKKFGSPTVTHDGVTVAREVELEDPFENMGAQLLKEAATKTNDIAGDGTTTSVVLAQAIVHEGLRNIAAGANPMLLKRGLEKGGAAVVAEIKAQSTKVEGPHQKEQIAQIATISAADESIGQLIADVMEKVGREGITEEAGRKLDSTTIQDLGRARRVTSDKDETTFVEGKGSQEKIMGRVKQIKAQIEETTSDFDKEKLQERLAKLAGGVAVIKVGAATEVELKEKKHRVEDALSAARAGVEEGMVPGGEITLINAIKALDAVKAEGDEKTGVNILRRALEEPFLQLVRNAGQDGSVVLAAVRRKQIDTKSPSWGYEVISGQIVDLPKAEIIDPGKVVRSAVENGASIAAMILTTEALITDLPEKEKAPAMPPGGMDY